MNLYHVIKRPLVTEKAAEAKEIGKYIFEVDCRATKPDVRRAIEKLFRVKVTGVKTVSIRGRMKRFGKTVGRVSDQKKAIVTLKAGDKIELFEGV